jgi:hypothetical protein
MLDKECDVIGINVLQNDYAGLPTVLVDAGDETLAFETSADGLRQDRRLCKHVARPSETQITYEL